MHVVDSMHAVATVALITQRTNFDIAIIIYFMKSQLCFKLSTPPTVAAAPGLFTVETDVSSSSGTLFLTRALDFELEQSYELTLSVSNNAMGTGPQCLPATQCVFSQTVNLIVTVGDENDNLPMFTQDLYTGGTQTHTIVYRLLMTS